MKEVMYDLSRAKQRCSKWLQNNHQFLEDANEEFLSDDPGVSADPLSDPFQGSLTYSADEETSNQSQLRKRKKRISSQDEGLSEISEVSQDNTKSTRRRKICQEEAEADTSASEMSVMTTRTPLNLRDEKFKLICGWKNCDFVTSSVEYFVDHVANHVPQLDVKCNEEDNEEVYACLWESCGFETPNADEVTRHVNFHSYHTKAKYVGALVCKSYKLPECNYGAAGVNLVPDLPKPLQCLWDDCTLTTNNPNTFFVHVTSHSLEIPSFREKHALKVNKFKCLWKGCKTEVKSEIRKRMAEHLRGHSKEREAACPTCGVLYSSRMRLIDHIKRQASEEYMTHQCTHCSRFYPSERILRDHMRHHVNHYKCQFCDMTCPTPHILANHIRHRHIDEKPFACEHCSYRAKTQYNMRRHMSTHSTEKNFVCEEEDCTFTCTTLSILNWHYRKKHEALPVYCCHMCDSRFVRGAYLTQHLMKKHNFRWPSGHTRFRFYKNHEDGLFRLQTVRYESLDVVEDINRREGEPASVLNTDKKFKISKISDNNDILAANFVVRVDEPLDDDPDDPDATCNGTEGSPRRASLSMPMLDVETPPRKVLISFDEVDEDGNIINSKTMEIEELVDIEKLKKAQVVADGAHLD